MYNNSINVIINGLGAAGSLALLEVMKNCAAGEVAYNVDINEKELSFLFGGQAFANDDKNANFLGALPNNNTEFHNLLMQQYNNDYPNVEPTIMQLIATMPNSDKYKDILEAISSIVKSINWKNMKYNRLKNNMNMAQEEVFLVRKEWQLYMIFSFLNQLHQFKDHNKLNINLVNGEFKARYDLTIDTTGYKYKDMQ
jgi:hypothetical protein